ncbi:hypothetical protein [Andreprevotia chitinilytica]|uniref:hypothetical protein n=1 Tax=Andreprevotia chitinilytica TaxID=396808 RepID=UPI000557CB8B|nr:hypothetical protein [Andreprevotia chitinilytica]
MKLAYIAALGFALSSVFAAAADLDLTTRTSAAYDSGLIVASTCVPRPFPACYYGTPGSQYYCPLTVDDIQRLTCTGPYAN